MIGLRRLFYRVAYELIWLFALVRPPRGQGAKAAVICEGEVLLVRHTYGPKRWELPGGRLRRGEAPAAAMRRELAEELGVAAPTATPLRSEPGPGRMHRHVTHLFLVELAARPQLAVDAGEIAEVSWCDPAAPPAGKLGPMVPEALAAARRAH